MCEYYMHWTYSKNPLKVVALEYIISFWMHIYPLFENISQIGMSKIFNYENESNGANKYRPQHSEKERMNITHTHITRSLIHAYSCIG